MKARVYSTETGSYLHFSRKSGNYVDYYNYVAKIEESIREVEKNVLGIDNEPIPESGAE